MKNLKSQISIYVKSVLNKRYESELLRSNDLKVQISDEIYNNIHKTSKKNSPFSIEILKRKFENKNEEFKRRYQYNNSHKKKQYYDHFNSTISLNIDYTKLYGLFGLLTLMVYKKIWCYPATDTHLEKVRNGLEKDIKTLEFKYQGKLRRQPIKYIIPIK
jgi:hypothetical protein